MPKLDNVKVSPELTTIEYGGDTYYRLADGSDPAAGDLFYVAHSRGSDRYVNRGGVYCVTEGGCLTDEEGDGMSCISKSYSDVYRDGIFFRKGPADKRAELARLESDSIRLRAEAARLRAEIEAEEAEAARIKVGDWVRGEDIDDYEGVVGRVTEIDPDEAAYPFLVAVAGGTCSWLLPTAVKITPAEARAAALAWLDENGATA